MLSCIHTLSLYSTEYKVLHGPTLVTSRLIYSSGFEFPMSLSEKKIHIIWGHIIAYCHMYFTMHTNGFMLHAACLCTIQLPIAKHWISLTIYLTPWSQIDRSNWARESIIQARVSKTTAVYIFLATRWRNYLFTASLVQFWPNQHELFELLLFRARLPSPSHVGLESSL